MFKYKDFCRYFSSYIFNRYIFLELDVTRKMYIHLTNAHCVILHLNHTFKMNLPHIFSFSKTKAILVLQRQKKIIKKVNILIFSCIILFKMILSYFEAPVEVC